MVELDYQEHMELADALRTALGGRYDGGRKNIIVPNCPYCGKDGGKFGVYVGPKSHRKIPFMSNCFSCGWSNRKLKPLLYKIGRLDLMPEETTNLNDKIPIDEKFMVSMEDSFEYEMNECKMPNTYSRGFNIDYLKDRGFTFLDFNYFEVGQTARGNYRFKDYVIFPVIERDMVVGYVSRHTWSKSKIDRYNKNNSYGILRYRNSTEEEGNDFQHLIYNIDAIIEGKTRTAILVEGIFDAIALTRKLNLYEAEHIAVCATFGKQITETKMMKLQERGIENVILAYDGDASIYTTSASNMLDDYFNVVVAYIEDADKDWDDLDVDEITEIFANNLLTPIEYNLQKI